jgi:hypothetical protein
LRQISKREARRRESTAGCANVQTRDRNKQPYTPIETFLAQTYIALKKERKIKENKIKHTRIRHQEIFWVGTV